MYTISFSKKAKNQLKKLEKDVQERIYNSLERVRIRPYKRTKKLTNKLYHSLRVGDYRIILRIKDDKLLILVIEVGHRKSVYKKL